MWCEIFSLNQTHYQIERKRRDRVRLKGSDRAEEIRKKPQ
jgi:hypothetical protein